MTHEQGGTVRPYHEQIDAAVENLKQGRVASFAFPGYAITYYLREIARDEQTAPFTVDSAWLADRETGELERGESVPPLLVLYATWFRDHITGELHTGDVLRFSIDAEYRAAVMAYALLEDLTREEE